MREPARLRGRRVRPALAAFVVPLLLLAISRRPPDVAWLLTGGGTEATIDAAATVLPWMVRGRRLAALCRPGGELARRADDYVTRGSRVTCSGASPGSCFILARVDADGIQAVARGMALNGAIAVGVPAAALALSRPRAGDAAGAIRPATRSLLRAAWPRSDAGSRFPLALQAIYLICVPLAAREGVGAVTSFGYAYLIAPPSSR